MRFANFATVRPEWIDYNGHMNVAYYVLALDRAADLTCAALSIGDSFRARGRTTFAAECWIGYRRELMQDAPLSAQCWLLAYDAKRLLLRANLHHAVEGWLACEAEWLILSIDLSTRRVAPWPDDTLLTFAAFTREHPLPAGAPPARQSLSGNR